MQNCGCEDLDLVSDGQMKLVVVKRNGTILPAKRRGLSIDIAVCFGNSNLPTWRHKAQNSPDPLVESLKRQGKTPFEVPNANS